MIHSNPTDDFEKKLRLLLEFREYRKISSLLEKKKACALSTFERGAWVESEVALLHVNSASILKDRLEVMKPSAQARILFWLGKLDEASILAQKSKNRRLQVEIFLASAQSEPAEGFLKTMPMDGWWYYQMGRCYGQRFDYSKAKTCLKKAVSYFKSESNKTYLCVALSNLAYYQHLSNEFVEAAQCYKFLRVQLRRSFLGDFPELAARIFLNMGHHFQEMGKNYQGLRSIWKSVRLLGQAKDSSEYSRAAISLAYLFMELGYFNRAVQLLSSLRPQRKYLILDQRRHLAICFSMLGESQEASKQIAMAKQSQVENDPFAKTYLPIDEFRTLFLGGECERALSLAETALRDSHETKNDVAHYYALSWLSWFTLDQAAAQKCLAFHKAKGLMSDCLRDTLTIAVANIQAKDYERASSDLNGLASLATEFPVQESLRLFLLAVCFLKLNKDIYLSDLLKRSRAFLRGRDCTVLELAVLHLQLLLKFDFQEHFEKYSALFFSLNSNQKLVFKSFLANLGIDDLKSYSVSIRNNGESNKKNEANEFEATCWRNSNRHITVDLPSKVIYLYGYPILFNKTPTQWNLLKTVLGSNTPFLSKEELARRALGRKIYNPLSDDNSIYVGLSRLKKTLNGNEIVSCKEEGYHVSERSDLVVLDIFGKG